jgi:hypothetical protein
MVFEILGHFLFKGRGETTIYGHDLHTIRCYFKQETKIYHGLGVRI